jgi:Glycosyl hydrolases family 35
MIEVSKRRLLVDGRPRIVLAGEVHYFRVPRAEWEQRIELAVEIGCDTVASYIPWLFHELPDGTIDVSGTSVPERDVGAFIDLCAVHGLSDSAAMLDATSDLRLHRGAGERRALARSALMLGYRFDATHLERSSVRDGTDGRPACLLVATARHMDAAVQQRLVDTSSPEGASWRSVPSPRSTCPALRAGCWPTRLG